MIAEISQESRAGNEAFKPHASWIVVPPFRDTTKVEVRQVPVCRITVRYPTFCRHNPNSSGRTVALSTFVKVANTRPHGKVDHGISQIWA